MGKKYPNFNSSCKWYKGGSQFCWVSSFLQTPSWAEYCSLTPSQHPQRFSSSLPLRWSKSIKTYWPVSTGDINKTQTLPLRSRYRCRQSTQEGVINKEGEWWSQVASQRKGWLSRVWGANSSASGTGAGGVGKGVLDKGNVNAKQTWNHTVFSEP